MPGTTARSRGMDERIEGIVASRERRSPSRDSDARQVRSERDLARGEIDQPAGSLDGQGGTDPSMKAVRPAT